MEDSDRRRIARRLYWLAMALAIASLVIQAINLANLLMVGYTALDTQLSNVADWVGEWTLPVIYLIVGLDFIVFAPEQAEMGRETLERHPWLSRLGAKPQDASRMRLLGYFFAGIALLMLAMQVLFKVLLFRS